MPNSRPAGWRPTDIGALAEVNPDNLGAGTPADLRFRYIDLSSVDSGTINWTKTQEMLFSSAPSRARRRVGGGDVLFGTVRPALRSHGVIPHSANERLIASTGFAVLRAKIGIADSQYLFHYLFSRVATEQARRFEVGSNYPAVNESDVRRFTVLAPPLSEQRRIAEILDTLDQAIRKTEQLIAKLKQVKQGLLHDLLTRGIDDNGELRDPDRHPEQFKDSLIGRVPRHWEVLRVEQLLADVEPAMRSGPFGSALLKSELVNAGIPLLGIDNVHAERFVAQFTRFVPQAKATELARYRVRAGDVMITIMGTVGRCCVVPDSVSHALSSKHVWTLTFDDTRYSASLACLQFNYAPWVLRHLARDEQGGIMSAIRSETLRTAPLPVPPPSEIRNIESIMRAATSRIGFEEAEVAKLKLLKHGLMEDLLTGRVRVTNLVEEAAA